MIEPRYSLITAATDSPVSLAVAKDHLRIVDSSNNDGVQRAIDAAVQYTQAYTRRQWCTATYQYYLTAFPNSDFILLPLPPLGAVSEIKYYNTDGTLTEFAATSYGTRTSGLFGGIWLDYQQSWPTARPQMSSIPIGGYPEPINIKYTCGYGAAADVPADVVYAILELTTMYFERRGDTADMSGTTPLDMPVAAKRVLTAYKAMDP